MQPPSQPLAPAPARPWTQNHRDHSPNSDCPSLQLAKTRQLLDWTQIHPPRSSRSHQHLERRPQQLQRPRALRWLRRGRRRTQNRPCLLPAQLAAPTPQVPTRSPQSPCRQADRWRGPRVAVPLAGPPPHHRRSRSRSLPPMWRLPRPGMMCSRRRHRSPLLLWAATGWQPALLRVMAHGRLCGSHPGTVVS